MMHGQKNIKLTQAVIEIPTKFKKALSF